MANGNGDPEVPDQLEILSKLGKALTDLSDITRETQQFEQAQQAQQQQQQAAAARDAVRAPGGGQGGGFDFAQELVRTAQKRNQQMQNFGGRDVRSGSGALELLMPTAAGPMAGAGRVGQGVMGASRGGVPTPRDLKRAGRFGSIDDILRISEAQKTAEGFGTLSRLFGGGPAGMGPTVDRAVLNDQLIPLAAKTGLEARKGDMLDRTRQEVLNLIKRAQQLP